MQTNNLTYAFYLKMSLAVNSHIVKCPKNVVDAHIVLPGMHWSLDTYFNLLPIYYLYVLFVKISYQPNIISCNFIYNANGIFKLWEFYCSHPLAGSRQSADIVSFPAGHAHSHSSARHTMMWILFCIQLWHLIMSYFATYASWQVCSIVFSHLTKINNWKL